MHGQPVGLELFTTHAFFALDHADALDAARFHFASRDLLFDACASIRMKKYKKFNAVIASIFTNTRFGYSASLSKNYNDANRITSSRKISK
jgi:hypothetical protein